MNLRYRHVSRNVVNWCITVGTSCTTNPQQIEAMELEVDRRVGNKPRRVNESTFRGEIFQVQSLAQSYRENYPYFGRYPNFIIIQRGIDGRKRPCQKPA